MGGAAGYDKLWRRIGSSACICLPMLLCHNPLMYAHLFAFAMVLWGSWSYFGWLTPGDLKERWFNYLAAALMTQCSILVIYFSWERALFALGASLSGSVGKVLIDKTNVPKKDVLGELWYGCIMCLGIVLSATIL